MFTLPDQFIQADGIRTRYWDAGKGPVVLLLHGLSEHVELWHLTIPTLLPHFRVVALDYLGHGLTEKPLNVSYDVDNLARFVKLFLDQVKVEKTHVVGHSLGAAVATKMALLYPAYIDRLVLQDAPMLGKEVGLFFRLLTLPIVGEIMLKMLTADDFLKFERNWRAGLVNSSQISTEFVRRYWEMLRQPNMEKVMLKLVRRSGNFFGTRSSVFKPILDGLPTINHLCLVVWGEMDEAVPVRHGEKAAKLLPNSHLEIIESCGHTPCLQQPDQFNKILLDFLLSETDETVSRNQEMVTEV